MSKRITREKSKHGNRAATAACSLALALVLGFALAGVSAAHSGPMPTVSGTPEVGQTLTSSSAGLLAVYKWERCNPGTAVCTDDAGWNHINGANDRTYVLVAADLDHLIRVRTKGASLGESFSASDPVGPVVYPSLDLSLVKSDSADPVEAGGALTYTIEVTNHASSTATGVEVTDPLPPGTTFNGASTGCSQNTGTVTCDLGSVGGRQSETVTISVAAPTAGGSISNTATVDGDQPDRNPGNDSGSAETTVKPPPDPPAQIQNREPDHGSDFMVESKGAGKVLIKLPGSKSFVPVKDLREIPFGSIVKADGVATITSEQSDGTVDTADFWGGTFVALQSRSADSYFVAKLRSRLHCGAGQSPFTSSWSSSGGPIATASAGGGRLWGSGTGKFRSRGRGGAATLRGTTWWWRDTCDGTEFAVTDGIGIDVRDPGHKGLVFLQPGDKYFAQL